MRDEFYLVLHSNSSSNFYPDNTTSSFCTQLPREINLDQSNWKVSLCQISYPHTINNVTKHNNKIFVINTRVKHNEKKELLYRKYFQKEVKILENYYSTPESLVNAVNNSFLKIFKTNLFAEKLKVNKVIIDLNHEILMENMKDARFDRIEYFNSDEKINCAEQDCSNDFSEGFTIILQNRLAQQLGFNHQLNILSQSNTQHECNLNVGIPEEIFVYISLIEPQIISDVYAKVIRTVKTIESTTRFGETIQKDFFSQFFFPLSQKSFTKIKVELRSSFGELINFKFGISSVILHFKKEE